MEQWKFAIVNMISEISIRYSEEVELARGILQVSNKSVCFVPKIQLYIYSFSLRFPIITTRLVGKTHVVGGRSLNILSRRSTTCRRRPQQPTSAALPASDTRRLRPQHPHRMSRNLRLRFAFVSFSKSMLTCGRKRCVKFL